MTSVLINSYPESEYLEGNFVEDYTENFEYFDRYVVKLFGERGILVGKDENLADLVIDWTQDCNAIVFAHLRDWAKMFSASIKDYEPLWNVDGTVVTTYGETEHTDVYGNTKATDKYAETKMTDAYGQQQTATQYGQQQKTTQHGQQQEQNAYGARENNDRHYATSYPDTTEVMTDRDNHTENAVTDTKTNSQYSDVETDTQHTDTVTANTYTDTHTGQAHNDTHEEDEHTDVHSAIEHTDTERRTGNIGVTKSTELVESEYRLRYRWNFYRLIFGVILREMGVHYYDEGNRCINIPRWY